MPGYKGHLAGGTFVGAAAIGTAIWMGVLPMDPPRIAALGTLVLLGALFPDVDTDSKGQHIFYVMLAVLDAALIFREHYHWAAVLGFAALFPAIGPHRGWTHTWWAMLMVPLPLAALPVWMYHSEPRTVAPLYIAAVVGYFSHLLLDRKF